jgi:hypothetical protein
MSGSATVLAPVIAVFILLVIDRWVYVDAKARTEAGTPVVFSSGSDSVI